MRKTPVVLTAIAIIVAVAAYPLWLGRYYATGDTHDVFIPLETFFQQEQLALRIPSWNPDIAWGFPVIASAQIGFFYPPSLVARLFPLSFYLPALFYLHILAAATGTYLLLRRQHASYTAAIFGALAFSLSQFVWQHATHLNIIFTLAWLPWQFLVAHTTAAEPQLRLRHISIFALVLGIPFLAGHMQLPILTSVVTTLYFLHQRRCAAQAIKPALIALAGIALLALGIAAAQLLPTAELTQLSNRATGSDFDIVTANQYSWPLYHLPTLVFPRFFGEGTEYWGKRLQIEYGFFIGTLPLLLALFAMRKHWHRYRFEIGLAAVAFLLALGAWSPVRLIGLEPSLWIFSAPARWLLFTTFALCILAAHGLDATVQQRVFFLRWLRITLGVLLAVILLGNTALWLLPNHTPQLVFEYLSRSNPALVAGRQPAYYIEKLGFLLQSTRSHSISLLSSYTYLPVGIILAIIAMARSRHWRQLLLAITAIELVLIAATTSVTIPWSVVLDVPDIIAELPEDVRSKQARIVTIQPLDEDTGLFLTNPSTTSALEKTQRVHAQLTPLTNAQFSIPGVEWPASLLQPPQNAALDAIRQTYPSQSTTEAAIDHNVGVVLTVDDEQVMQTFIPAQPRAQALQHPESLVTYHEISPTTVRVTADLPEADTIIIRDSFYPGWQATVDDTPTAINRHGAFFREVDVPAGAHTIELTYHPRLLIAGAYISLSAILICALLLLWPTRPTTTRFN